MPFRNAQSVQVVGLLACAVVLPLFVYWGFPRLLSHGEPPATVSGGTHFPISSLPIVRTTIGPEPGAPPLITHIQIIDFDRDGLPDVLACDARLGSVILYRQDPPGRWNEHVLADQLVVPAHATVVDLDQDGDFDVLVSELGNIWPDDGVVGRVVLLEQRDGAFVRHTVLDDVRRVADVQPGDFDGDGDIDLAVAVFGYARGQILWLENRGGFQFYEHELMYAPGTIHVPVADYDSDGDLDIAAVVSQDEEELWVFENLGAGEFRPRRIFGALNFDLGAAGLIQTDLDGDGDADLLLPVGDNFEDQYAYPQPYHGCLWFENQGDWNFVERRIAEFGGTYAAATGDLDADGDIDVVLVSMANDWDRPENPSIVWLENDGDQNFRTCQIANRPIHLVTVACGDLNGDGRDDIVAGGLHARSPFDRLGRITAWISNDHGGTR